MLTHYSQQLITIGSQTACRHSLSCLTHPKGRACYTRSKIILASEYVVLETGGNDVSMIQAGRCWCGHCRKRRQASLLGCRLLHRAVQISHKTARMAWSQQLQAQCQIIAVCYPPRCVICSVCQVVFSVASQFGPNALYRVSCFRGTSIRP